MATDNNSNKKKEGFKNLFTEMNNSPEGRIALMQIGLNMMQPRPAGQSEIAHAAQGVGEGLSTFGKARIAGRKEERAEEQHEMEKAATQSDIDYNEARGSYYKASAQSETGSAPGATAPKDIAEARRRALTAGMEAEQEAAFNDGREFDMTRARAIANSILKTSGIPTFEDEPQPQAVVTPLGDNKVEYQGKVYTMDPAEYERRFGNGS